MLPIAHVIWQHLTHVKFCQHRWCHVHTFGTFTRSDEPPQGGPLALALYYGPMEACGETLGRADRQNRTTLCMRDYEVRVQGAITISRRHSGHM